MGFFSDAFKTVFGGDKESKGFERAQDIIARVEIPAVQSLILDLGELVELGQMTPQEADAFLQESTGFDNIQLDPELQRQQYASLQRFGEIADSQGLDAASQYRLREARDQNDTRLRGDLAAIDLQAQRRGEDVTSGMDMGNRLLAAQSSANRMADEGFAAAALAQQRADEANMQRANLAGNIESADYSRQADAARAGDIINQFNTSQRQAVANANTERVNDARRYNLDRDLTRQLYNIGQRDREEASRVGAIESDFDRRNEKARDEAEIRQGRGVAQQKEDDSRRGNVKDIITGGADIASGAAALASMFSDPDIKENVEEIDIDEFLDSLTGYKYNLKGDDEETYGVMSTDLKKTPYGESMVNEEAVMGFDTVDYGKSIPGILASVVELNKKVKKLEGM